MKSKHSLITGRLLLLFLLLAGRPVVTADANAFSQGIYSRNAAASEEREVEREGNTGNGVFRAGGTENTNDGGQASKISPLKDGWGILVIAGIGYAFVIRRRHKANHGTSNG